jgi:hypothetical protein
LLTLRSTPALCCRFVLPPSSQTRSPSLARRNLPCYRCSPLQKRHWRQRKLTCRRPYRRWLPLKQLSHHDASRCVVNDSGVGVHRNCRFFDARFSALFTRFSVVDRSGADVNTCVVGFHASGTAGRPRVHAGRVEHCNDVGEAVCNQPMCAAGTQPVNGTRVPNCSDLQPRSMQCEPFRNAADIVTPNNGNGIGDGDVTAVGRRLCLQCPLGSLLSLLLVWRLQSPSLPLLSIRRASFVDKIRASTQPHRNTSTQ